MRQFMYLAQFEITYEYLPGKSNDVADALSRVEVPESGSTEATRREQALSVHSIDFPARFDVRRLQSAQNSDSDLPGILDDPAHPLKLSKIPFGPEKVEIYCERRENVTRPTRLISGADCSPAEMLYGGPLRIPGDLCFDEETKVDPKIFKSELRAHMSKVKPVLVDHKRKQKGFVADDLSTCSYVFKLDKRITTALVPPYTGPHRVLDRNDKFHTITIDDHGRESVVSIERLKPAHFIVATDAHAASSYSVAAAEAVNTSVRASSSERPVAPVRVRGARNTRRGRRK
uniref:Reverse transcriptase RNase H-like domain-containing protein n=1 Tax=Trichogramma kaykai TaxID=54128 RepID=A0ABD2WTF9_9HYME